MITFFTHRNEFKKYQNHCKMSKQCTFSGLYTMLYRHIVTSLLLKSNEY